MLNKLIHDSSIATQLLRNWPVGPESSDVSHLHSGCGDDLDMDYNTCSQLRKKALIRKNALLLFLPINPFVYVWGGISPEYLSSHTKCSMTWLLAHLSPFF